MHRDNGGRQQDSKRNVQDNLDSINIEQHPKASVEDGSVSPAIAEYTFARPVEKSEDMVPLGGIPLPAQVSRGGVVVTEQRKIDRVFLYLIFVSAACLVAVTVTPSPEVRMVALGIWAGSVALAKYLLGRAYR